MVRKARQLGFRILPAALALASCASAGTVTVDLPPLPDPVVCEAPLPYRVGITRWELGPLTDALVSRLRAVNLFAEVYYPLESSAEMDAAIEFDVERTFRSSPTVGEYALDLLSMGMATDTHSCTYSATVLGELSLRVGERTLKTLEKSVAGTFTAPAGGHAKDVLAVLDQRVCEHLAAQLVDELCREPTLLAADLAAGPGGSGP